MNAIDMLQAAVVLFVVAAIGGIAMAGIRLLRGRNPPDWVTMVHGLVAAAGLTLVAYAVLFADLPSPAGWALLLLLVTAGGGAALNLLWQQRQRPLPVSVVLVHAGLAVVGFVLLVVAAY